MTTPTPHVEEPVQIRLARSIKTPFSQRRRSICYRSVCRQSLRTSLHVNGAQTTDQCPPLPWNNNAPILETAEGRTSTSQSLESPRRSSGCCCCSGCHCAFRQVQRSNAAIHLVGFISLPGLGNDFRIENLTGCCRVKLKSLNHKFCLTEMSLFQGQDLAKNQMFHEETSHRWYQGSSMLC